MLKTRKKYVSEKTEFKEKTSEFLLKWIDPRISGTDMIETENGIYSSTCILI